MTIFTFVTRGVASGLGKGITATQKLDPYLIHTGVRFHPEFQSRPNRPHPLFLAFVQSSLTLAGNKNEDSGSMPG